MRPRATSIAVAVSSLALIALAPSALGADQAKKASKKANPDYPKRVGGQMTHGPFFKKYPDTPLILSPRHLYEGDYLGSYSPGKKFGIAFRVSAKGEKFGLSHKSAPNPQSVMICKVPSKEEGGSQEVCIRPDGGCG